MRTVPQRLDAEPALPGTTRLPPNWPPLHGNRAPEHHRAKRRGLVPAAVKACNGKRSAAPSAEPGARKRSKAHRMTRQRQRGEMLPHPNQMARRLGEIP